ncbi:MAG: RebB family R body protein [Solimonas sp.]
MNDNGTVNSQIVDSVTGVGTLVTGQAPAQAFGMLDAVLLETLGMAMHNAVNRQQGGSMVGAAAVTAACAKMLAVPYPPPPPPPPPIPTLPTNVHLLPGPPHEPPPAATVIAGAYADAEAAIKVLQEQAKGSSANATAAQNDLAQLVTDATPPANAAPLDPNPPPPPAAKRRKR